MLKRCVLTAAVVTLLASAVRIALAAPPASSQNEIVQLDPSHTNVNFTLPGYLHTTHGRFTLKSGIIRIDPATGQASGEFAIDAASENSNEDLRDAITRHAVLEVERYPEIIFWPQRIQGARGSQDDFYGEITGLMQIHGGVHEITAPVHGQLTGDQVTAVCDFLIPYTDWGLESPNVLSSDQIIQSTKTLNLGFGTRIFPVFAYMLPTLRKIPPNLFWVSNLIDVKVETHGRITWASQPQPRDVTIIVPPAAVTLRQQAANGVRDNRFAGSDLRAGAPVGLPKL